MRSSTLIAPTDPTEQTTARHPMFHVKHLPTNHKGTSRRPRNPPASLTARASRITEAASVRVTEGASTPRY
ncbi:hypothetical protein GCM10025768_02320 [Microbacterium pseudoresistens]